jgi:hypothetical protein
MAVNETEWLANRTSSQGMLWLLCNTAKVTRTKAGRRKARLFACGCCRLIWEHLNDPRLREAVAIAERHATGSASGEELALAGERIRGLSLGSFEAGNPGAQERTAAGMVSYTTDKQAFSAAFGMTAFPMPLAGYLGEPMVAEGVLCDLLRCVFGNPFRPVTFAPAWRAAFDGAAVKIAAGIYTERAFDRMPILGDALEDAGCDNEDILAHCRSKGPHTLGCWVVDSLLTRPSTR